MIVLLIELLFVYNKEPRNWFFNPMGYKKLSPNLMTLAFSPNGDNNNDILYVYGKNIEKIEFAIYNRWGEKVFEQNCSLPPSWELPTPNCKGWDGVYKNEKAEQGVYAWFARVRFKGEIEEPLKKGTVMLLR